MKEESGAIDRQTQAVAEERAESARQWRLDYLDRTVCSSGQTLLNRNGRSVASGSRQDSSTWRRCVAELSFAGRASSFSAPRSDSPRRWKRGIEDPVRLALPSNPAMQQGWVPPRCSCGRALASASAAWRDPCAVTREARPCELQKGRASPSHCAASPARERGCRRARAS